MVTTFHSSCNPANILTMDQLFVIICSRTSLNLSQNATIFLPSEMSQNSLSLAEKKVATLSTKVFKRESVFYISVAMGQ